MSIGLLPDFLASRVSGTLDEFEDAALAAEEAPSQWKAAERLRPHDGELESVVKWVRFRVGTVRELLRAAVGLVPELFGCAPTLRAVRGRLGAEDGPVDTGGGGGVGVLRRLRALCERYLGALAAPLGLVPRPEAVKERKRRHPQSTGPDPPHVKA